MNNRPSDEERRALIASEHVGALDPDEAADVALLADLLSDPSTWTEPGEDLEDDVVLAVAGAAPSAPSASPGKSNNGRRLALWIVAAAAALAIGFGAVTAVHRSTNTDYQAQLSASGLAPGAHASADVIRNNAGFRVVLDAHGLPALPPGEYYQAWLKTSDSLVPIGTFSSSDGRVTLWSGISPKDAMLSVTIESTDNNQASSGRRVLSGAVRGG